MILGSLHFPFPTGQWLSGHSFAGTTCRKVSFTLEEEFGPILEGGKGWKDGSPFQQVLGTDLPFAHKYQRPQPSCQLPLRGTIGCGWGDWGVMHGFE